MPRKSVALVQLLDASVEVETHHRRTACEQRVDASLADTRGRASDQRNFAGEQRRLARFSQLGLLEIPILDLEDIPLRQRCKATEQRRSLDHVHRVLVEIRDDCPRP